MTPFLQHPLLTLAAAIAVPAALMIAFSVRLSTRARTTDLLGLPLRELAWWIVAFACAGAWMGLGVWLAAPPVENPAPYESEIVR